MQLLTAMACLAPAYSARSCSKRLVLGPVVIQPERMRVEDLLFFLAADQRQGERQELGADRVAAQSIAGQLGLQPSSS